MPDTIEARPWNMAIVVVLAIMTMLLSIFVFLTLLQGLTERLLTMAALETRQLGLFTHGAIVAGRIILGFWLGGCLVRCALFRRQRTRQRLARALAITVGITLILLASACQVVTNQSERLAELSAKSLADGTGDDSDEMYVAMRPDAHEYAANTALFIAILPAAFAAFVGAGGLAGRGR